MTRLVSNCCQTNITRYCSSSSPVVSVAFSDEKLECSLCPVEASSLTENYSAAIFRRVDELTQL